MKSLITQIEEESTRIAEDYLMRNNHLNNLKQYVAQLDEIAKDHPLVYSTSVMYDEILLYTNPIAFLSFEVPELLDLIEKVETLTGVPTISDDYPDSNFRIYRSGPIKIFATPKEDGLCARVMVGTKKEVQRVYEDKEVEVPVYEFKC